MSQKLPPLHYHDYLKLEQILSAQSPRSTELRRPAHDEMLFIVVHQTYELWFKQLLHELDSVLAILGHERIAEPDVALIMSRLQRMGEILKLLIEQVRIMETMTPLDFLEFRDLLHPASGFQSFQFRLLETKLGLKSAQRLAYNSQPYHKSLREDQAQHMQQVEKSLNLFDGLERWLERTPFLAMAGFDFWQAYQNAVRAMFARDREALTHFVKNSPEDLKKALAQMDQAEAGFKLLFDEELFNQARSQGQWRLSYRAVHAALLIQLYRDQPILQLPFRVLTALLDLDEMLTTWRYRHALMARRMLGSRVGTGGSSGFEYLKAATDQHKIFTDLFQLTTFFIPRSSLPKLPAEIERELNFLYSAKET